MLLGSFHPGGGGAAIVSGEVSGIRVREDLLVDHPTKPGRKWPDIVRARLVARLGGPCSTIYEAFRVER